MASVGIVILSLFVSVTLCVNVERAKSPPILFNNQQSAVDEFDFLATLLSSPQFGVAGLSTSAIQNFSAYLPEGTFYAYLGCRTLGQGVFQLDGNVNCLLEYSNRLRFANQNYPSYRVFASIPSFDDFCKYLVKYRYKRCPSTNQAGGDDPASGIHLISPDPSVIQYDGTHNRVAWALPIIMKHHRPDLVFDFKAVYEIYGIELNIETIPISFEVLLVSGTRDSFTMNHKAIIKQTLGDCGGLSDCYEATIQEKRIRALWVNETPVPTAQFTAERVILRLSTDQSYGDYAINYYAIRGVRWLARKVGEIEGDRPSFSSTDITRVEQLSGAPRFVVE